MSYLYSPYRSYARPYQYSPTRSYVSSPYYTSTPPRGNSWVERIPVEQRYTEYVPEQRIEYKPVERRYTDYVEIEHYRDYVPVPRLERRVEYVPIERYDEAVDYVPVERSSVVRQPLANSLAYSRYSRYPSRYYY
ncbi:unnamed protein product [Paramecium primaurelia]|uniref:Uncharacterized protein n=1 Tax=Paramecium primaurelia TaxID=5886 RepID=A0A8S1N9Q1_PARPR|nr:unnamed protein product [Paramecium primaurelia]